MLTMIDTTTKKITKQKIKNFVRAKLSTDPKWATKAVVRIFQENQTADERTSERTIHHNGIGFSGTDSEILSSFATQYIRRGSLSPKQMAIVHKLVPKYWKQVISMSDENRLVEMVRQSETEL
jgi:hypothetical protein